MAITLSKREARRLLYREAKPHTMRRADGALERYVPAALTLKAPADEPAWRTPRKTTAPAEPKAFDAAGTCPRCLHAVTLVPSSFAGRKMVDAEGQPHRCNLDGIGERKHAQLLVGRERPAQGNGAAAR
jgi:hypothetical protein